MTESIIRQSGHRLRHVPLKTTQPGQTPYVREVAVRVEYDAESDLVEIRLVASLKYADVMLETARVQLQELEEKYQADRAWQSLRNQTIPEETASDNNFETFEDLWSDTQNPF